MFRSVHVLDRNVGGSPKEIIQGNYVPMDIRVWDPKRQPYKWTPCERNNGGCSHLCLLAPYSPGFTCACPTGIKLIDNFTCANGMYTTCFKCFQQCSKTIVNYVPTTIAFSLTISSFFF